MQIECLTQCLSHMFGKWHPEDGEHADGHGEDLDQWHAIDIQRY